MGDLDTNISLSSSLCSKTKVWHIAVCVQQSIHVPKCYTAVLMCWQATSMERELFRENPIYGYQHEQIQKHQTFRLVVQETKEHLPVSTALSYSIQTVQFCIVKNHRERVVCLYIRSFLGKSLVLLFHSYQVVMVEKKIAALSLCL